MALTHPFRRNLAVVIGVDKYQNRIPTLRTAVSDAVTFAESLEKEHEYEVWLLTDEAATLSSLLELLNEKLPAAIGKNDRLLFYFAGHGIAMEGNDGPVGYLLPQDSLRDDPNTFLEMRGLQSAIARLSCRHLLVLLDCCFAGAFRWSSTRNVQPLPAVVHRERYERYVVDEAWQVITSAAHNQQARDVVAGSPIGRRGNVRDHSPFANALFDALRGEADLVPAASNGRPAGDGVITATQLYTYLRDRIERENLEYSKGTLRLRQTPGLWMLNQHRGGEYIFFVPGSTRDLPPAPQISLADNPYRGLSPYEEKHRELFFGREDVVAGLLAKVMDQPLTVVLGASGSGKSSLVLAGLLPRLREITGTRWHILASLRPLAEPLQNLSKLLEADEELGPLLSENAENASGLKPSFADLVASWRARDPKSKLLLVVDQLDELFTMRRNETEPALFLEQLADALRAHSEQLHIVATLRSDYEPHFAGYGENFPWSPRARFIVPSLSRADLREVILKPAETRVLYFDPPELVEKLVDEVVHMPGALPLLSFTLSEMYARNISSRSDDRALTENNYLELGGVIGSLRHRANEIYESLDEPRRRVMRHILLRMVAVEGREVARRRVPKSELDFPEPELNQHVEEVLKVLSDARLISEGQEGDDEPYAEPAHDALVAAWDKLRVWLREERDTLILQRRLTQAANEWVTDYDKGRLWDDDPRLPQTQQLDAVPGKLNRIERNFVRSSVADAAHGRRLRWGAVAGVIIVVAVFAVIFWFQRNAAIRQQFTSLAQALAAESSKAVQNGQDERATLLAIQAYRFNQRHSGGALSQVDTALRNALGLTNFSNIILDTRSPNAGKVNAVVISPNGQWLAVGSRIPEENEILIDNLIGYVLAWDLTKPRAAPRREYLRQDYVNALAFSPDSRTLAAVTRDGDTELWDVSQPAWEHQTLRNFQNDSNLTALAFSRDSRRLAVGKYGQIMIWDLSEPKRDPVILWDFDGTPSAIVFSPDGQRLACGTKDVVYGSKPVEVGKVMFWDLNTGPDGSRPKAVHDHDSGVVALKFDPDNRTVIVVGKTPLAGWDTSDPARYGRLDGIFKLDRSEVVSGAFNADGRQLLTGTAGGEVIVTGMGGGDSPAALRGHQGAVNAVAISYDQKIVASAGEDQTVRLWNLEEPFATEKVFSAGTFGILAVVFQSDGKSLLAGNSRGEVRRLGLDAKGAPVILKSFNRIQVERIAVGHNGNLVVLGSPVNGLDPTSKVIDVGDMQSLDAKIVTLKGSPNGFSAVAIAAKNRVVVAGSYETIHVWNMGEPLSTPSPVVLQTEAGTVTALAVSPDGRFIASGHSKLGRDAPLEDNPGMDMPIYLWDLANTNKPPTLLGTHRAQITSLGLSPDARLLASGSADRTARVWNLSKPGETPIVLRGHENTILTLAFSPDGARLVTGSKDGTTRIWSLKQSDVVPVIWPGAKGAVLAVAYSPDGKSVAAGYTNGEIVVWAADVPNLIALGCGKVRRNLTIAEWGQFVGAGVPYEKTCEALPPGT